MKNELVVSDRMAEFMVTMVEMEREGLVVIEEQHYRVTEAGVEWGRERDLHDFAQIVDAYARALPDALFQPAA
jgi:predicted transcriptional regulator